MSMSRARSRRFVLVLTLPETAQAAVDFLRVCAKLGILQRTAVTDFRKASEQQGEAQAWHCKSDHTQSLSTVFNEQEVTAMSVLSLRPYGMTVEQYADEDSALQAIQNVLPTGLRNSLRLATVAPALPEGSAGDAPFSSYWDFHLVCDGRAASSGSQQSQTLDAQSDAALAQALLAGLSAVGGWNCPSEGFTEITPHDAGIMGVRFCHASMRVICSAHTDYGARSGVIPQSTPWPLPHEVIQKQQHLPQSRQNRLLLKPLVLWSLFVTRLNPHHHLNLPTSSFGNRCLLLLFNQIPRRLCGVY